MRDISLSRDNSLCPTKGKGPFSATLSPTIKFVVCVIDDDGIVQMAAAEQIHICE